MYRGLRNYEDEVTLSPKINVKTGKPLNLKFTTQGRHGRLVDKIPTDSNHLQECNFPRNPALPDRDHHHHHHRQNNNNHHHHNRQQQHRSRELTDQENAYPQYHSSSLNLSDSDKLHSGKYVGASHAAYGLTEDPAPPGRPRSLRDARTASRERSVSHGSLPPANFYDARDYETHEVPLVVPSGDHRSVDTVKKIADDIIREKDSIIESQRLRLDEMESRLKSMSLSRLSSEEDSLLLRDLQKENQSLRRQLHTVTSNHHQHSTAATTTGARASPGALERELCALEYKLNESKKAAEKGLLLKDSQIAELSKELSESKKEVENLRKKSVERDAELEKVRTEVERMLKYMSELPPVEEHRSNVKKMEELKEALAKSEKVSQEKSVKLKSKAKAIEGRDREVAKLKGELEEARGNLEKLQSENKMLDDEVTTNPDLLERRRMREANEKLTRESETMRKVYEAKVKQLQVKLAEEERERKSTEEALERERKSTEEARRDLSRREVEVQGFKENLREVVSECERLNGELRQSRDDGRYLRGLRGDHEATLFRRLVEEFESAFEELRCIVRVCRQKADNKEPDLEDLFGTRSLTEKMEREDLEENLTTEQMLETKCQRLKDLRLDIDHLRGELAEFVAEDLGRRLTCSIQ